MNGKYILELSTSRIKYSLDIDKRITVIRGQSGSGKTLLYRIATGISKGVGSYRSNFSDRIKVLTHNTDIHKFLTEVENCFIFADENIDYIRSEEFAKLIYNSKNYFILITRSSLDKLTYSYDSVYELDTNNNITRLVEKYKDKKINYKPNLVICEDKNSGYEMFSSIFKCKTLSSEGKDKIYNAIINNKDKDMYVICDGAGFGNCIAKVMTLKPLYNFEIWLPWSFEYLLLTYPHFNKYCVDELNNTHNYANENYKSWERFYTYLIQKILFENYKFNYTKSRLHDKLKSNTIKEHVKSKLIDLDRSILC